MASLQGSASLLPFFSLCLRLILTFKCQVTSAAAAPSRLGSGAQATPQVDVAEVPVPSFQQVSRASKCLQEGFGNAPVVSLSGKTLKTPASWSWTRLRLSPLSRCLLST